MHRGFRPLNRFRSTLLAAGLVGLVACQAQSPGSQRGGEIDFESEITLTHDRVFDTDGNEQKPGVAAGRLAQNARAFASSLEGTHLSEVMPAPAPVIPKDSKNSETLNPPNSSGRAISPAEVVRLGPDPDPGSNRLVSSQSGPTRQARPGLTSAVSAADRQPPASSLQAAVEPSGTDRMTLLHELARQIRESSDPPIRRAIELASLSVINDTGFNVADLKDLGPEQRRGIATYRKLLVALRDILESGDRKLDRNKVVDLLYNPEVAGHELTIRKFRLVKSVVGYGVYDEFSDNRLLAGRETPVIIYLELDDFQAKKMDDDRYQVRLAQEVELYTPDGVVIWHQPREEIVDRSSNLRRDFFVTQFIRLPANLGVGEFMLKVRVTDLQSNTLDERSRPIVLVADQRLVSER